MSALEMLAAEGRPRTQGPGEWTLQTFPFQHSAPPSWCWRVGQQGVEAKASGVTDQPLIKCGLPREP